MRGTYCLIIYLKKDSRIKIGKRLGYTDFKKGYYVYVGSVMNSLESRIRRHLSDEKKLHWHVDYLLKKSKITDVIYNESTQKIECTLSQYLQTKQKALPNSDAVTVNVKVTYTILKIEMKLLRMLKTLLTQ